MTEWNARKPTLGQAAVGTVAFLALAALSLSWSADETVTGNRVFLWVLAGLFTVLAVWRTVVVVRLLRERARS